MTSVDGISRLAELIRQRVGNSGAQRTGGARAGPVARRTTDPASFSHLIDRVGTIDPTDPDKQRKAFRFFLEAALLTEFGMDLINDPGFYALVDRVQTQIESNPRTHTAARSAAALLLKM